MQHRFALRAERMALGEWRFRPRPCARRLPGAPLCPDRGPNGVGERLWAATLPCSPEPCRKSLPGRSRPAASFCRRGFAVAITTRGRPTLRGGARWEGELSLRPQPRCRPYPCGRAALPPGPFLRRARGAPRRPSSVLALRPRPPPPARNEPRAERCFSFQRRRSK